MLELAEILYSMNGAPGYDKYSESRVTLKYNQMTVFPAKQILTYLTIYFALLTCTLKISGQDTLDMKCKKD
jgi:hypothetical protein